MVRGSAPLQMMKKGLGEALWREKEKLALAWLDDTLPTLKRPLTSDAWLGMGEMAIFLSTRQRKTTAVPPTLL